MKYLLLVFLLVLNQKPNPGCDDVKHKIMDFELKPQLELAVAKIKAGKYVNYNVQPGLQPIAKRYNQKIIDLILYRVDAKVIKENYSRALSNNFSCGELESILGFYETRAGKKFLAKKPIMSVEVNDSFSKEVRKVQPAILEVRKEFLEKIKAPKPALLKKPGLGGEG